ncbi:MAG: Txe/YoeB family addiction module toxin [Oscillospiraceae bacterium]|jgi:toxin YoeB|nr:Txe/YoeB family addiction module toxin [Oscillospiraceae bacterium]
MNKLWHDTAWADYTGWQTEDKKTLRKINALIRDVERNGYDCIGKPEPLKGNLTGWWSVHIDDKNRLVFKLDGEILEIYACRGHYDD